MIGSRRRAAWPLVLLGAFPGQADAQGVAFQASRLVASPDASVYSLSYTHRLLGPLGGALYGTRLTPRGDYRRALWGLGGEVTVFEGGEPGIYLIGGVEGGFTTGDSDVLWSGWTAGAGFEAVPLDFLSLAFEGRYHTISAPDLSGLQLGARFRVFWSTGGPPPQPAYTVAPPEEPPPDAPAVESALTAAGASGATAERLSAVVEAATAAMGRPYVWGGRGGADGGFDCSGLIQHAYGTQGIALPRVSRDQARAGAKVEKDLDALRPGDILTFSTRGGPVTHVGLYVGEGRFIHSASQGVQMSELSPDDVYGRWWWRRWVGARRILE